MTCREKLAMEHPEWPLAIHSKGGWNCPSYFGYMDDPDYCKERFDSDEDIFTICNKCWDREISKEPEGPKILDSGDRTEFESGAVRDMRTGKGRCDLMPLDVVSEYFTVVTGAKKLPAVLTNIDKFQKTNDVNYLYRALEAFVDHSNWKSPYTMFLEVAKHFEEGCIKYGENNWRKGIPAKYYIDSAIRHYLKHKRGDKDEPHDRAFCWNILCCIWTIRHHPELNDYMKKEVESNG